MDKIRIINLGGQDEIYKNLTVIEINNDIFVIECGVKSPDISKPGIDYIIPRYDYLLQNKDRVRAYILTHGHESIIGALPYIYEKVPAPIYLTKITSLFFDSFCSYNNIDPSKYNKIIVDPSQDVVINNRPISFFAGCCNFADSLGVSIKTDQGNIVYISNFVIDHDNIKGFTANSHKLGKIAAEKVLVLLLDSAHAERPGYCSPNYRLIPLIRKELLNLQGRTFLSIDTPDLFNIIEVLNIAARLNKKVVPYDEKARNVINILIESGFINLLRDNIASIEDVNRIRPQDLLIFITGFGNSLNHKVSLLASKNNDDKIIFLNETDTFIYANHISADSETSATEALDELYHNECKIVVPSKKQYCKMHACEEDIKAIVSNLKPRYFIPVSGYFKQLLANAKIAVNMNIGLNHNNVFIVDNGHVIEFEAGIGKLLPTKVISGDLMIDGKGVGDIETNVLEERQKFSDDGVIILAATISKEKRKIVAGPDVQARGLVFIKDSESLIKEITRLFVTTIETEIAKESYSMAYLEETVKDITLKAIRRALNKTPIIIPIIAEIK